MEYPKEIKLKYGFNPYQTNAKITSIDGKPLPARDINGNPGSINTLEVLRGMKLVNELDSTFGMPAAAALKHINPAGAAIAKPLDDVLKQLYSCGKKELSPLATAYYRADGTDPKSAYGGTVCLSRPVDFATALAMKSRVIDVVCAPGYSEGALEILKAKKKGAMVIFEYNNNYKISEKEIIIEDNAKIEFDRNDFKVEESLLEDVVGKPLTEEEKMDLMLGIVVAKYVKSNKTIYTLDGQTTGVMACQQSRVDSMKGAGDKSLVWLFRQMPEILHTDAKGLTYYEKIDKQTNEIEKWYDGVKKADKTADLLALLYERKKGFFRAVTCGFLPFADCVVEAANHGVGTIAYPKSPGKGIRFEEVKKKAEELGIKLSLVPHRLFKEN